MKKLLACLLVLILPVVSFAWTPRTITDPAAGSALSSATMRTALQTLENEIANMFATTTSGVSTSTIVGFHAGMFSVGSSTIQDLHATYASTSQLSVTGSATSTFAGSIDLTSNHSRVIAHAFVADESDGLRLENGNLGLVALLGAGNGLGTTFYGGVNIDGATRLATSLSGGLGANNGVVYAGATTTAGTGLSYSNGQFLNDGVTSISGTSPIVNNVSTGAVSLTCPTCAVFAYPFPNNATTSILTLGGLTLTGFSGGLGANGGVVYGAATTTAGTGLTYTNGAFNVDLGTSIDISSETNLAATWPVVLTGDTLSWDGLATSSAGVVGTVPYFTSSSALGNVATGTISGVNGLSINAGAHYVLGSNVSITCTTGSASAHGCIQMNDWTAFNNKVSSSSLLQLTFTNATGTSIMVSASSTIQVLNSTQATIASSTLSWLGVTATSTFYGKVGRKLASSTGATAYTVDWDSGNSQKFLLSANSTFDINATSSHPVDGFFSVKICNRATAYTFTYQGSGAYVKPILGNSTTTAPSANQCVNILYQWDAADAFYQTLASTTSAL